MKINNQNYESIYIGKLSEQREEKSKEVCPDKDKMDLFVKEDRHEQEEISIKLDMNKLKNLKSSGSERDSLQSPFHKEISVNFGDIKGTFTRVIQRFNAEKDGTISSLDMDGYMIPANEGHVSNMCLTYGLYEKENYLESIKTFVSKMPSAKFTVLTTNEIDREELKSYIEKLATDQVITNPERVNIVNSNEKLSMWAQDSTLVVGNRIIEQDRIHVSAPGDKTVAKHVAEANPEVKYDKMEDIYIDGGNQLATNDKLFVGSDAIAFMVYNMKTYPEKYNKIIGDLKIEGADKITKEELAKLMLDRTFPHQKVVIVGYQGLQPAFHIDMAMTPLGKPDPETGKAVITVGDPSMATGILTEIKKNNPEKYAKYEEEIKKKIARAPDHSLDYLMNTVSREPGLQTRFDAIARGFEQEGYKIERVPYLGSTATMGRGVPWITYNNSVIDGDNIFIPNFGIPELDEPSNNLYKKYGYTPVPMDMTAISSHQGAINCITKVIERQYTYE